MIPRRIPKGEWACTSSEILYDSCQLLFIRALPPTLLLPKSSPLVSTLALIFRARCVRCLESQLGLLHEKSVKILAEDKTWSFTVIDVQARSIPQHTSWQGFTYSWSIQQILRLRGVPLATAISGCRQTGFPPSAHIMGRTPIQRASRRGSRPLDLNRYIYFNSKPGGIAANCVTVCESHGKTIN